MTYSFQQHLAEWGPARVGLSAISQKEAEAYCRNLANTHYENFTVISRLLPKKHRQDFANVYSYCRWSDDLGDEIGEEAESLRLLAWWREQLQECYRGKATHPVFVALEETIAKCAIPCEPFADLITAFEQDQRVKEYETYEQLLGYCRNSANPVGRLVLYLCGVFNEENSQLSDAVCTGLQLANFWQDVKRDKEIGRIYLPAEDFRKFGYSKEEFQKGIVTPAFIEMMRFEVDRTRKLLQSGFPLVENIPGRLQVEIDLFIRGGLKILELIEAIGYRVLERRPRLNKSQYAGLFVGSACRSLGRWLGFVSAKDQPED